MCLVPEDLYGFLEMHFYDRTTQCTIGAMGGLGSLKAKHRAKPNPNGEVMLTQVPVKHKPGFHILHRIQRRSNLRSGKDCKIIHGSGEFKGKKEMLCSGSDKHFVLVNRYN